MRATVVGLVALLLLAGCASTGGTTSASSSDATSATVTSSPVESSSSSSSTSASTVRAGSGGGAVARVTSVTDGDTVHILQRGRDEAVRLIGINAPETGECFADEAAAALSDLVDGQRVRLVRDQSDRDQYGRLLRYLFVGDTFVNEVLVRQGFAQAYRYDPDTAQADRLDAAQQSAEDAGRGLWAPDACGRARPHGAGLAIDRIEADPQGDDTLDPNAEFVVVRNDGATSVDLSGWGLKDETASHRFTFPPGFALAAGASVTVHTGCGTPTTTDLFWCNEGSAIWNNDGDTAFLLDPNGNVVDTRSY